MRNSLNASLHVHLFYEDEGIYLLDKLRRVWPHKIYVSLNKDGHENDAIINYLRLHFNEVDFTLVDDKGTDQYGFWHSFKKNKDDTKYIFYFHDKKDRKEGDKATDPFFTKGPSSFGDLVGVMEDGNVGIIASKETSQTMPSHHEVQISHQENFFNAGSDRLNCLRALSTIAWFDELVFHLRFLKRDVVGHAIPLVYPKFSGGTVLLATRKIVETTHSAVIEEYFQDGYQTDGKVEHAIERLYYYVCTHCHQKPVGLI
jgi:hypothetical protein